MRESRLSVFLFSEHPAHKDHKVPWIGMQEIPIIRNEQQTLVALQLQVLFRGAYLSVTVIAG